MKSLESITSSAKTLIGISLLAGTISLSYLMGGCGRQEKRQSINPSKIVFNSDILGNGDNDIYIMDADGKNRKRLTDNPNFDAFSSLSKYGKIAFTSGRDKIPGIYVMDLDGKNVQRLSSKANMDLMPSWSPDGEKIAFYSERDGNAEIYVMNADGSKQKRLTSNPGDDARPSWSPDGKEIFFDSDREGNAEIYVMNADGSGQKRLTKHSAVDIDPSCSVTGTVTFSSDREGVHQIYVMDADGNNVRKLTNGPSINAYPVWSEDGNQIFFASTRIGKAQIYSMNANGSNQKRVNSSKFDDCDPSFSVLEDSKDGYMQKNNQEENLEGILGDIKEADIKCLMGYPDAKLVALYLLKTKNTLGKNLHNARAELYLLDQFNTNNMVSIYVLGNVENNSEIEAVWKIEASSELGKDWQNRQRGYFNANERVAYAGSPDFLIFIKSKEGVFEVNSSQYNIYCPTDNEMFLDTKVSRLSDFVYSSFEKAGIKLPKK